MKPYLPPSDARALPVVHASHRAEPDPEQRWMIEPLWGRSAVGVIGAHPKANKSYLALDMALSVASSTPSLDTFAVRDPGPALIYMAEDSEELIKQRLLGLCRHRGLELGAIPLYVITAASLRLDVETDRDRLDNTVTSYAPRLLVLDPLVRMHALNENDAGEISGLLGYLRALQRTHDMAVLLVHHTRKNGSASPHQAGQNLRGSSDVHAWSDSSLYLRRRSALLTLLCEHRAAPAPDPLTLALVSRPENDDTHLEVVADDASADNEQRALEQRLLALLHDAPKSRAQLRRTLHIRNERLGHLLDRLASQGRILHADGTWSVPFP
jgi:hypothetical protein